MKKFATAVNCMDGRVQEPVIGFLKSKYSVDYVDMITEPGPDKILAEDTDKYKMSSIKQRLDISVNKHGSKIIMMVGHVDCAGNPVDKETHIAQTLNSAATIKEWFPDVEVLPVWIGENWEVEAL
ncbi:MAG: hypothetical protein K8S16_02380 [Bacteroidales bacterium]|nr:hypothetical protein [Bacteroidales bacterium]